MPVTFYPKDFIIQCDGCKTYGRLNSIVTQEMIPCAVICTTCEYISTWINFPILPKVQPNKALNCHFIVADLPEQEEVKRQEYAKPESFYILSERVSQDANSVFQQLDELQNHINNFSVQFSKYFKEKFGIVTKILSWNDGAFVHFLRNPFSVINIQCENKLANNYVKWLVYPSFVNQEFGIPISRNSGLNIDLISQYTRLQFPLETELLTLLDLPQNLDLEVRGTKILGSSLPFCWQDIPGTVKDIDHSEEWPSICIRDAKKAKTWLIEHGINPWQKIKVQSNEIVDWEIELDSLHFRNAWLKFLETGRVCIFWPQKDLREARKFAYHCARKLQGTSVIFTTDEQSKRFYETMFQMMLPEGGKGRIYANRTVLMAPGEPPIWDAVLRTNTIIVDLYGDMNYEILANLFGFKGRIIILGPDPVLDLQESCAKCNLVYGLTGYPIFPPTEMQKRFFGGFGDGSEIKDVMEFLRVAKSKS